MENNLSVKKILILAANPLSTVRLNLDREVSEIRTSLQLSANRDRFTIEDRGAVRPDQLQEYMHDLKPQIVHFSGHGGDAATTENEPSKLGRLKIDADAKPEQQGFMLDDHDEDKHNLVSGKALSNLFKMFNDDIECVVLNACYSATQAKEIVKHVPYVVAMSRAITDVAARKFSVGFYTAIWNDRSIKDAFDLGINAIGLYGLPEESIPQLFPRDDRPAVGVKPVADLRRIMPGLKIGLFASLGATAIISLARVVGLLQPLELDIYDRTLQSRLPEKTDDRILVIEVKEKNLPTGQSRTINTLSDQNLDQLLNLLLGNAKIIGLDNYLDRTVDPKYQNIKEGFKSGSLVGTCDTNKNIKPPDGGISVGFADVILDEDRKVRRHLLSMHSPSGICNIDYALSAILANQYLQDSNQKINLPFQDNLQLGVKKNNFLTTQTGAYQWYGSDFGGYQTILNYRSNKSLIDGVGRISLEDFLEMSPEQIAAKVSNKIVLIGTTEVQYSDPDIHETPYGKLPGVFLQAQMTSQLVSAALEGRPLIWAFPWWGEVPLIFLAAATGAILGWRVRRHWVLLSIDGALLLLLWGGSVFLMTLVGYWLPVVPITISFLSTGVGIGLYRFKRIMLRRL